MAKSIEEAFKKAGFKKESLHREHGKATQTLKRGPTPLQSKPKGMDTEKSFEEQMRSGGIVPVKLDERAEQARISARPISAHDARSPVSKRTPGISTKDTRAANAPRDERSRPNPSKDNADLNRYLALLNQVYGQGKSSTKAAIPSVAGLVLEIVGPISPSPALVDNDRVGPSLLKHQHDGITTQIARAGSETDEVDIVIGCDFGTSSVKVVVRDKARGAYAVPFFPDGVANPYLLPSRLYEFNGVYQLDDGGVPHRDLKLSLLRKDTDVKDIERAAAFLALVIRRSRGWLLSKHGEIYRHTRLNWSINLGLPAANYQDAGLVHRFRVLAIAAMNLAAHPLKMITSDLAAEYCRMSMREERRNVDSPSEPWISTPGDMVDVVPEIAAQIYGYVQSSRFDRRASNVYMMVDVGAGTVDASIFHVRKERANRYGFVFFANNVEQNGVMNLHRERIHWLTGECAKVAHLGTDASNALSEIGGPTDRLAAIPEHIEDYFRGITLHFNTSQDNPDEMFFRRRYWRQVFGDTLNFVRNRKLYAEQLMELPFFLAGGGARMDYYERLVRQINNNDNIRWARLRQLPLERPKELEAPALREAEYDRLSVAFGLSFLKLGTYVRAQEVPDLPPRPESNHYDKFISKDQM